MPLRDFLGERRVVVSHGRRFSVRTPTVRTVAAALSAFGAEILGCRMAYLKAPELFGPDPVMAAWPFFADPDRLAPVLATCVELHGGAPGEMEEVLRTEQYLAAHLLRAAVEICDIGRIVKLLDLDPLLPDEQDNPKTQSAPVEPPKCSAMELLATGLAERFHVDPFTVWEWPYEAVMSLARDILPTLYPPAEGEKIFGRTRAEWAAAGVTLTDEAVH